MTSFSFPSGDDLREFARGSRSAARRADDAIDRGVKRTVDAVYADSQIHVPVKTGELRDSGTVRRIGPGEYEIRYTADHAIPVEKGSDPHVITPRDAEALRFEVNGQVVYAAKVKHPGTSGVHFLGRAVDKHRDDLGKNIRYEFRRDLRIAFGK